MSLLLRVFILVCRASTLVEVSEVHNVDFSLQTQCDNETLWFRNGSFTASDSVTMRRCGLHMVDFWPQTQ